MNKEQALAFAARIERGGGATDEEWEAWTEWSKTELPKLTDEELGVPNE